MNSALATAGAGLLATAELSVMSEAARALGLVRVDFPRVLGTTIIPNVQRARRLGWVMQAANGVLFAFAYQPVLRRRPGIATGAALGFLHFAAAMTWLALVPRRHPRPGTAGVRPLSPTAYGAMAVPGMLLGHLAYGATLGAAAARRG